MTWRLWLSLLDSSRCLPSIVTHMLCPAEQFIQFVSNLKKQEIHMRIILFFLLKKILCFRWSHLLFALLKSLFFALHSLWCHDCEVETSDQVSHVQFSCCQRTNIHYINVDLWPRYPCKNMRNSSCVSFDERRFPLSFHETGLLELKSREGNFILFFFFQWIEVEYKWLNQRWFVIQDKDHHQKRRRFFSPWN